MDVQAQNFDVPTSLPSGGEDFIQKILALDMPTQEEFLSFVHGIGPIEAFLLVICGAVYLLSGWKIFKALIVVNAAVLGTLGGYLLGTRISGGGDNMPYYAAAAGGLVLAVMAWPLMKYAVSLMGGLAGSFVGYGVWLQVAETIGQDGARYAWAGALIGLITLGLLAFVIFRFTIMVFTALQGAAMLVTGLMTLAMQIDAVRDSLESALESNRALLQILLVVPAVVGFVLQNAAASKKARAKKKAMGGADG